MTAADLTARRAEVIVILKGVDEGYMQPVITRHSFRFDEIVWGGRFTPAFSGDGGRMRLDLDGLSRFQSATPLSAAGRGALSETASRVPATLRGHDVPRIGPAGPCVRTRSPLAKFDREIDSLRHGHRSALPQFRTADG